MPAKRASGTGRFEATPLGCAWPSFVALPDLAVNGPFPTPTQQLARPTVTYPQTAKVRRQMTGRSPIDG